MSATPNSAAEPEGSDDAQPSPGGLFRFVVLALLMLSYVLNFADRQVMGILAPAMKADLHLTDSQLGLLAGFAFALTYAALGVPLAMLADRFGRTRVIAASIVGWSIFTALTGMATNFAFMFWCRLGVGVGEAGGVAPAHAIITSHFPRRQWARALAFYALGVPVGSAAGLMAGAALAAAYGWRETFFLCGALGLVLGPVILLVVREPRPVPAVSAPQLAAALPKPVYRNPAFWLIAFGAGVSSMTTYSMAFWMPSFLERSHQLSPIGASRVLGFAVLVAGSVGTLVGGPLADRLGARTLRPYLLLPALLYGLATPAFAGAILAPSLGTSIALYGLATALIYATFGPLLSAVQLHAPPSQRAGAAALFYFVLNLIGLGVGNLVVGGLSDALHARFGTQSLRYAILADLVFLLVGAALLWRGAGVAGSAHEGPRPKGPENLLSNPRPMSAPDVLDGVSPSAGA